MAIKKKYQELIDLLQANDNKKVATIMPQILELVQTKGNVKTFHKDEDGKVIAIYCYYHKEWELLEEVEYGKKKSTSTGFNTMCKDGLSNWTKQQRQAKLAKERLLDMMANGDIDADELKDELAKIEEARQALIPQDPRVAFGTLEEALEHYYA